MSRRPFVLLSLSLVTVALAACSESPTGPTSQRQLAPTAPNADMCTGGYTTSTGKC